MKPIFPIFLLLCGGISPQLLAQQPSGLEFQLLFGQSDGLLINRDYSVSPGESDIGSGASPTVELQLRRAKPLSEHWRWVNGFSFGIDSYNISLFASDDFNRLGWGGFSDHFTEWDIYHLAFITAMRYERPFNDKNSLWLQLGLHAAYYLRAHGTLGASAILDSGQTKRLFYSEMRINDANTLALAPEIQLAYRRAIRQSRWHLLVGTNVVFSNFEPLQGAFQIIGDNQIRLGEFQKRWLKAGVNLGVQYQLSKRLLTFSNY